MVGYILLNVLIMAKHSNVEAQISEILRAVQKDHFYTKKISVAVSKCLPSYLITKYQADITTICTIFYRLSCTGMGFQTLGEEYTGLVEIDEWNTAKFSIPTKVKRILYAVFPFLPSYLVLKLKNNQLSKNTSHLQLFINVCEDVMAIVQSLIFSRFFVRGNVIDIWQKILGIRYISVAPRFHTESFNSFYRILSIAYAFRMFLHTLHLLRKVKTWCMNETAQIAEISQLGETTNLYKCQSPCSLCRDNAENPTVTHCGHLFCWECIHRWLISYQNLCPVCKSSEVRVAMIHNL